VCSSDLRDFVCQDWPQVPKEHLQDLLDEADAELLDSEGLSLVGYDQNGRDLAKARQYAQAAGVDRFVHFQPLAFDQLSSSRKHGCIISRTPYDDHPKLRREQYAFYGSFPEVLRRLPTWSHFFLSPFPDFEAAVGQEANRRRKLFDGKVECQYYQYFGPPPKRRERTEVQPWNDTEPDNDTAVETKEESPTTQAKLQPSPQRAPLQPAFGGLDAKADVQADLLKSRLLKNARHLRRWPKKGIHCYRLYDRDIPEIPLVIDRYHDHLHITDYVRPTERTVAEYADWLDHMAEIAGQTLDIPADQVFVKRRARQAGKSQHQRVADQAAVIQVEEGGLRFEVNLSDYVDTGLFLDHRNLRSRVGEQARGKHVLNLFCYTGAFSVYAAAGGAVSTTSVDLSATYLDWAGRNFQLNDLSIAKHHFIRADVVEYLRNARPQQPFDMAIVDVPTFSNSKRLDDVWDVQRDHVELIQLAMSQLKDNGLLYFSNNFRRFKLDEIGLADFQIREISKHTIPEDFRDKRIHRCWSIIRHSDEHSSKEVGKNASDA